MNPERWERIESLFHAALERGSAERGAFLAQACGSDDAVLREVEALLAADAAESETAKFPANLAAEMFGAERVARQAGDVIGRYQILSLLGRGGMGEVYAAKDARLGRKVAVKLLPAEFSNDRDRMRRFEREAQAASALNHPSILTVHEIGEAEGNYYLVTELVEGQTLRQRLSDGRLELSEALDVVAQVAAALAAAHAAGIVHRDIKPENVMLRPDGLVKVLDFGLAKVTESSPADLSQSSPDDQSSTEAGVVLGTARYMSPEQARGLKVDARTDIWSLGVVLYELVTGRAPFAGATMSDVIVAILTDEPTPLVMVTPDAPSELQRIVSKALQKDCVARYQDVGNMLLDLKHLERRMEVDAEVPAIPQVKILLGKFNRHKFGMALLLATLVIVAAAFFFLTRTPPLTGVDTVLVADFINSTGDPVFDGTLKLGLSMRLEQSPYLRAFSDEQVKETLRYMTRSPNEPLTKEIAREICLRRGLKAFLTGSIVPLGSNYALAVEAINARTGEALAREQIEARGKEQVLSALDQAYSSLRAKLGKSLSAAPQINVPREHFTTPSLEALRAYYQALEAGRKGKNAWIDMIPFFKRAIELDPSFAKAWEQLASAYFNSQQQELAEEAIKKAYALRDRESDLERVFTTALYHRIATLDTAKAIEVAEVAKQSYPDHPGIRAELSIYHLDLGQHEEAIKEAREAVRLNPKYSHGYTLLAISLMRTNRFVEAREVLEQGLAQKLNNDHFYRYLYLIAFVQGDTGAMRQQVDRLTGTLYEAEILGAQAQAAAFAGKLRQARELSHQAITLAEQRNLKDSARRLAMEAATREAAFEACQQARQYHTRALSVRLGMTYPMTLPIALALCGESAQARSFSDKLHSQYPNATKFHAVWWPVGRAAAELQRGRSNQVAPLLQFPSNYEQAAYFWPNWLRGQAYLRQQAGKEASAEFQEILDHRGWDVFSPLYPLAQLGLARAATLSGDAARARKAYQDFLALWKDADADLPILVKAKKEYEKLK